MTKQSVVAFRGNPFVFYSMPASDY